MYITLDIKGYNKKPHADEIKKISRRISKNVCEVNDLRTFAEHVSERGHTWCPAVFNGPRKTANFKSTQLIALDFDGGISFDTVTERCKKYMLPILFAYETFSSIDTDKFRVVFMLDKVITDINIFNIVIDIFMSIFPECDSACKDAARMFFGGKRLIYFNENECTVKAQTLMMNFSLYLKDKHGQRCYKKHIEKFTAAHRCKNSPYVLYSKTTTGEKVHSNHNTCRSNVLDKLLRSCHLYREFAEDSEWLYYNELYGLATNLIHIETGKKTFLKYINNSQYDTYKRDWKFYLKYFKDNEYLPMKCEKFCPYHSECHHANNMLDTVTVGRKKIVRLKEPEYAGISEVQAELKKYFYDAMGSGDNMIHVIKAQTAIGKTHMYLEYLKSTDKPCIIAVPTNKLKNEVYNECMRENIYAAKTPSVYELKDSIPYDIYEHIGYLYKTGRHQSVMEYIKEKAADVPALKEYVSAYENIRAFDGHIITTHHKLLYSSDKWLSRYNIIIDEDILKTITRNQLTVDIADIKALTNHKLSKRVRDHLLNIAELAEQHMLFSVEPTGNCKVNAEFDLNALLNAEYFYSDSKAVTFYQAAGLMNMKYTVLSATADEYIYKSYFGSDRIVFHTCKTAKYRGRLIQYYSNSYSRRYIQNNSDTYENISKISGDVPRITFKKFSEDEDGIHFGNSEGCNCMKGQDMAVIGTPHMADFMYKLLAYRIGYDGSGDSLRYLEITHNGYRFWFYTYENELLRRIQLWMIESELEQSVGRARLLREDCTVWLFSNLPLPQSDLREGEEELLIGREIGSERRKTVL